MWSSVCYVTWAHKTTYKLNAFNFNWKLLRLFFFSLQKWKRIQMNHGTWNVCVCVCSRSRALLYDRWIEFDLNLFVVCAVCCIYKLLLFICVFSVRTQESCKISEKEKNRYDYFIPNINAPNFLCVYLSSCMQSFFFFANEGGSRLNIFLMNWKWQPVHFLEINK